MKCIYSSFEPPKAPLGHHCGFPSSLLVWGSDSIPQRFTMPFFTSGVGGFSPREGRAPFCSFQILLSFPLVSLTLFWFLSLGGLLGIELMKGGVDECVRPQGTAKPVEVFTPTV